MPEDFIDDISEIKGDLPFKDKLHFCVQFTALFTVRLLAILLGFVMVPIGLLFKKKVPIDPITFRIGDRDVVVDHVVHMPKLFFVWDNFEEGCASLFHKYWESTDGKADSYLNMLYWSCIRNPANNMRMLDTFRCDMTRCKHEYKVYENSMYCKSTNVDTGKVYFSLRRRKWFDHEGQHISSILHVGFKVLRYNIDTYRSNPGMYEQLHHRYRGFGLQIIPRKGLKK